MLGQCKQQFISDAAGVYPDGPFAFSWDLTFEFSRPIETGQKMKGKPEMQSQDVPSRLPISKGGEFTASFRYSWKYHVTLLHDLSLSE